MKKLKSSARWYVYLLWFIDTVVYVGQTGDYVRNRLKKHREKDGWDFDDVDILGPYYTLERATSLEQGLIEDLHPIHNIQHNDDCRKGNKRTTK